jgi:cytochrome c-type biogenesis protein CcmH
MLLFLVTSARAVEPAEQLADPALEARARAISQELRCQVCQNQSIDDSNAPLAADLRRLVRERLQAGDSDDAIFAFLTQRYGDNVLLRPPLRLDTALLWFGPPALLLAGGAALLRKARRRQRPATAAPLSAEEEARLAALAPPDQ